MSPRKLTPLTLAALVLFAGAALAVPVTEHGPPAEADTDKESFAIVSVYGPVLDAPIFTILAQEPREDMVYGPDLNEKLYDLRVRPGNWRLLVEDAPDSDDDDGADTWDPWDDRDSAPLQDAPNDDGSMVPCGCHSASPGDDTANSAPTQPNGDDAPNHGQDGDDVDNDDGMDGDDSDNNSDDVDDSDRDDTDRDDTDGDGSDADDNDSDDADGDDSNSDDNDSDDDDVDDSDDDGDDSDI